MTNKSRKNYQSLEELDVVAKDKKRHKDRVKAKYRNRKWLSEYQYQIYRVALYGLKAFSKAEVYKMTIEAKNKIVKFYKKAQIVLNRWKQQIVNAMFEELCSIKYVNFAVNPFHTVFKNTVFGVERFGNQIDDSFECMLTFEELNITREQVISKLIVTNVLPNNFYQLQKPIKNDTKKDIKSLQEENFS